MTASQALKEAVARLELLRIKQETFRLELAELDRLLLIAYKRSEHGSEAPAASVVAVRDIAEVVQVYDHEEEESDR